MNFRLPDGSNAITVAAQVSAAAGLTANAIVQNTLTIGAGGSVVIRETPPAAAGGNPVPEPATWAMIAGGLVGLLLVRRRIARRS